MKTREGFIIQGWYRFGCEGFGFVSIWGLNKDESVRSLGTVKLEKLDKSIPMICPYP